MKLYKWYGDDAKEMVEKALKLGINMTTSAGAIDAKREVHRKTTALQGSIYPEAAVMNSEGEVEGVYGVHRATNTKTGEEVTTYAVWQEFLPGEALPDPPGGVRARAGGRPYLRPSMATAEKNLKGNLSAAYHVVELAALVRI